MAIEETQTGRRLGPANPVVTLVCLLCGYIAAQWLSDGNRGDFIAIWFLIEVPIFAIRIEAARRYPVDRRWARARCLEKDRAPRP